MKNTPIIFEEHALIWGKIYFAILQHQQNK